MYKKIIINIDFIINMHSIYAVTHTIQFNDQKYIVHEEILKYCNYFDIILKGNFNDKNINLKFDFDLDFSIIIDILYGLYFAFFDTKLQIKNNNELSSEKEVDYRSDINNIFVIYSLSFEEFINVIFVIDYLQLYEDIIELLIKDYSYLYKYEVKDVLDANIDNKYKRILLEENMKNTYTVIDVEVYDRETECDNIYIRELCENHNIEINNYYFKNVYIDNIDIYEAAGKYNEDVNVGNLYMNDVLICENINYLTNIRDHVIKFIMMNVDSLLDTVKN